MRSTGGNCFSHILDFVLGLASSISQEVPLHRMHYSCDETRYSKQRLDPTNNPSKRLENHPDLSKEVQNDVSLTSGLRSREL